MHVIAFVGMPGSGKSEASAYVTAKVFFSIRFGELVISEVQRRGLPITPRNEQIVRENIRTNLGMDALAKTALPWIREKLSENQSVVIDGLYSLSEYKTLSSELRQHLIVLAIFTPKDIRYKRLESRAERPLTQIEARDRDFREIERLEKGGPIALADYTILNDGNRSDFHARLEVLINKIVGVI